MGESEEVTTAAPVGLEVAVHRDLRRNYLAHLGHGIFGQTGFRLLQAPTFIPAYI
jgi:hypothetical protein